MKKLKQYFKLNRPYEFDLTDIVAIIYLICVVGIICGLNMTPLFLVGCIISFIACLSARRLNLVAINGLMIILNIYYLIN